MSATTTVATDVAEPPTRPGFAAILRDRTAAVHREAERAGFIADLIRNRATRHGYALLLRNLVPAYDTLEHALDARTDDLAAPFADRALRRGGALRADLEALAGPGWAEDLALLPEAEAYARDITATAGDERLVAHAYARYLGDLSGGQILKPVLARTLGLGADALTFYDFPAISSPDGAKTRMREALDSIEAGTPAADAIVAEAIAAFRHNIAVSLAVQAAAA